ncbi:MAG: V-type ATP synthase subunit F [Clostridiales bacterium]|nr:V-type ATP synthase subunit F [Clostridiales bacterium]MCD7828214.1 V-type ATP synthase subunit F [Clostridiales bacterium]
MYKIAVMGDKDSIFGFASVGLSIFPVTEPDETEKTLRRLINEDYAVIFITEKAASGISAEIDKYKSRPLPAIIPIPGVTGNTGIGMSNVSKSVEQAVGSDILK